MRAGGEAYVLIIGRQFLVYARNIGISPAVVGRSRYFSKGTTRLRSYLLICPCGRCTIARHRDFWKGDGGLPLPMLLLLWHAGLLTAVAATPACAAPMKNRMTKLRLPQERIFVLFSSDQYQALA